MILHYKDIIIDKNKINYKKKIDYSRELTFIPIKYDDKDILIQTPVLYSPFGINHLYNCIDLSFQCNDVTDNFINNCLNVFYKDITIKYNNYSSDNYIRTNEYSKWMRYKINKYTIFYNQDRKKIDNFDSKVRGSYIIHLSGIWLINGKISFNWIILQAKIYQPIVLKEYSFIDEEEEIVNKNKNIPKPPPLPPPPPPPLPNFNKAKKIIPKNKSKEVKDIVKVDKLNVRPALSEIMDALKKLNKVK